ncbi:hypothetical protein MKW98_011572 [Papaver atlanticum]|uniref:Cytochrome P450 n=1 Tax=Papaver atlanticum TaxID=357466 RepID=A0AAD4S7A1_9MAGN|nr:hypothetical protein MKW98_011572 [Papaver atlanticum]
MDSSWITMFMSLFFIPILFLFSYLFLKSLFFKGSYQLPPGPYGLPILGNLHRLGDLPHQNLQKLSLKYGPIMYMRLGLVPAIVVTSPELAELILKTHDIVFASRSILESGKYFGYEQKGLVFKQYGSAWRNIRKLCTLHLLTNSKIESFKPTRESEVRTAVESIKVAADSQVLVNLSLIVESLAEDITHKIIFGSVKNDRYNSKTLIQEAFRLAGAFNVADYIPYTGPLDLQGLARQMKSTGKLVDEFLEHIIDQHIEDHGLSQQDLYQRDFVDILLSLMNAQETTMNSELKLDRENVKAISLDMIGAMMDTLGDLPHQDLQKLSLKYGPIMYMKLGLVPVIVISSPESAELVFKTHDIVFASRPILQCGRYFGYEQKGVVFKQYGSSWRYIRKLCTVHLLTNSMIESFKSTRESEVRNGVESIKVAAASQVVVNLSFIVGSLAEDITHKTIFGSLKDDQFNSRFLIQDAFRLIGAFNIADYIPYVGSLDLQGYEINRQAGR